MLLIPVSSVPFVLLPKVTGAKNEIRLIYHFHFTAWPDHGVPKYATALLEFHKKVDKQHKRKSNKPMMVHCRYSTLTINILRLLIWMLQCWRWSYWNIHSN